MLLAGPSPVRWCSPAGQAPLSLLCVFQLLVYPNVRRWGDNILQLVPTYLQSKCRVMRRLVLRGLLALCKTPLMVRRGSRLKACWQRGAG